MVRAVAVFVLMFAAVPGRGDGEALVWIAHAEVPLESVAKVELREIFLKKKRQWSNGQKIRPIERNSGSRERNLFLSRVLELDEIDSSAYWIQQKQNTGAVQPVQVSNEEMMIYLVETMPGAIGYVFQDPAAVSLSGRKVKIVKYEP